jgi:hypothetical protein
VLVADPGHTAKQHHDRAVLRGGRQGEGDLDRRGGARKEADLPRGEDRGGRDAPRNLARRHEDARTVADDHVLGLELEREL